MRKYYIYTASGVSWSLLGFTRGSKSYEFQQKKQNNTKYILYSTIICHGLIGVFLYCNPIIFPIVACKEIYRLEVNLRGLEDEKKTDYYNKIL